MIKLLRLLILVVICSRSLLSFSQRDPVAKDKSVNLAGRFVVSVHKRISFLNRQLVLQSEYYVRKLMMEEAKLKRDFARVDANTTKDLFQDDPESRYLDYVRLLVSDSLRSTSIQGGSIPYADSVQWSLLFLSRYPIYQAPGLMAGQLTDALISLQQFEGKINLGEELCRYINTRKEQIRKSLRAQPAVPRHLRQLYSRYNQQVCYYSCLLQICKNMLNDPDQVTQAALKQLRQLPDFGAFIRIN